MLSAYLQQKLTRVRRLAGGVLEPALQLLYPPTHPPTPHITSVAPSHSHTVIQDMVKAMFNRRSLNGLFHPQDVYSNSRLKSLFHEVAHSSVMRLHNTAMDKVMIYGQVETSVLLWLLSFTLSLSSPLLLHHLPPHLPPAFPPYFPPLPPPPPPSLPTAI